MRKRVHWVQVYAAPIRSVGAPAPVHNITGVKVILSALQHHLVISRNLLVSVPGIVNALANASAANLSTVKVTLTVTITTAHSVKHGLSLSLLSPVSSSSSFFSAPSVDYAELSESIREIWTMRRSSEH